MTTWLQHVKKVHASGSASFKESLKRASASWKKTKGAASPAPSGAKKKKPRRKKKKKCVECEEKASTEEPAAPKKKRRRAKKAMPKLPASAFKSVDSINV